MNDLASVLDIVLDIAGEPTVGELAEVEEIEASELENDSLFSVLCRTCGYRINLLTCRYVDGNVECKKCNSLN